jgi:glycerate dehydrogenase
MSYKHTKVAFLDAYTTNKGDISFEILDNSFDFISYDRTFDHQFYERSIDEEVLIVNKFVLNAEKIQQLAKLKLICVAATGYNNIDLNAAKKKGIMVCNAKAYSTHSVAQHIFGALLAITNRSAFYNEEVKKGRWSQQVDFCFYDHSIPSLSGKTLGIYGFGNIGKEVAKIACAFGMKVLVCNRSQIVSTSDVKQVDFHSLLKNSDVVSLHVSLNDDTYQCINRENLNLMKHDAILINTGRGPLINEQDLSVHLTLNPKFTAVLDVLCQEPPEENNGVLHLPNCFITPHIAWAGKEARESLVEILHKNILGYLDGKLINVVS